MAGACWLAVAAVAGLWVPGRGAACWESSVCSDPSREGRALQDCIHYCLSVTQAEFPELRAVDHEVSGNDDDDGDLLLSIILALLATRDKATEADVVARGDQRRSYTMEHFRWGKPPGDKPAQPKQRAPSSERRSYTMEHFRWGRPSGGEAPALKGHRNGRRSYSKEHFRWGKPPGRKRRPVEAPDSPGGRQVQMKRAQGRTKTQDRKAGAYRMGHFRWGGASASKRVKPWQEKLLADLLRTVTVKDLQRRLGRTKREEEEVGLVG